MTTYHFLAQTGSRRTKTVWGLPIADYSESVGSPFIANRRPGKQTKSNRDKPLINMKILREICG